MSLSISVVNIKGKGLFSGRSYRVALRQPALAPNEYYHNAEDDGCVFAITPVFMFPDAVPNQRPTFVPNLDAVHAGTVTVSVILEEARRAGGAMSKCGVGTLSLDSAALQRATKSAERREVVVPLVDQSTVIIECLASVVVAQATIARPASNPNAPANVPPAVSGARLPTQASSSAAKRVAPAKEAAALRHRLMQKRLELETLDVSRPTDTDQRAVLDLAAQLEAYCDEVERDCAPLRTASGGSNRIEHLEAHLGNLERRVARGQHASHQQEMALIQERDATEAQLAKLDPVRAVALDVKRRQRALQQVLAQLDAECQIRDVSHEAAAALGEHDAIERALSVLTLPKAARSRSLPQRFDIVKRELDAKQAANDVSEDTISLLNEHDILEAALRQQHAVDAATAETSDVAIPLHYGHEWSVIVAKEAALDHIRHTVSQLASTPCMEAVRAAPLHPSTFPSLAPPPTNPVVDTAFAAPKSTASAAPTMDDLFR